MSATPYPTRVYIYGPLRLKFNVADLHGPPSYLSYTSTSIAVTMTAPVRYADKDNVDAALSGET